MWNNNRECPYQSIYAIHQGGTSMIQQLDCSITRTKGNKLEIEYTVHKLPLAPYLQLVCHKVNGPPK